MPLEIACEKYKDALLFSIPTEGYGWAGVKADKAPTEPGTHETPPSPFWMRILEFYYFAGKIRAGVGRVEQQGHPQDNQWVGFCIRDGMGASTYNFDDYPAQYNIGIGQSKHVIIVEPQKLSMSEWIQFGAAPYLSGLGYIVDSAMTLERIYARKKQKYNP